MSAPEGLLRYWQQKLIDERGGPDGTNLERLADASLAAHIDSGSRRPEYGAARAFRAALLGACALEVYSQFALMQESGPINEAVTTSEDITAINAHALDDMPSQFTGMVTRGLDCYWRRYSNDQTPAQCFWTTGFGFYGSALADQAAQYFSLRIAYRDFKASNEHGMEMALQNAHDGLRPIATILADNVLAAAELAVAAGVGLCLALRRVGSVEEHVNFFKGNIPELSRLASANDSLQMGKHPALPFGYPYGVLNGSQAMLSLQPIRAVSERECLRAEWTHPSLKPGNWEKGEYCPGAKEYRLRPRTDEELTAIRRSLAVNGLDNLIHDSKVYTGLLVLNNVISVSTDSIYQDPRWQEQVLRAHGISSATAYL